MGPKVNNDSTSVHYESRERKANEETTLCVCDDGSTTTSRGKGGGGRSAAAGSTAAKSRSAAGTTSPTIVTQLEPLCRSPGTQTKTTASVTNDGSSASSPRSGHRAVAGRKKKPASKLVERIARCYELPVTHKRPPCVKQADWQNGEYVRDECGSGIVTTRAAVKSSRRRLWCKTPLSMYQATIGELGRKILCHEQVVPRDVKPGPPCTVCDDILPPCRGYYRKYPCLRPCEEEFATRKAGKTVYRREFARYWEPCLMAIQSGVPDINEFAGRNVYLASKLRRENNSMPCW